MSVEAHSWIPDDHVNACCVCHAEFTVVNRRHHCRVCGNVVCGACSSSRIELKSGTGKERVCDRCEVNFTEQGLTSAEQLTAEKDMTTRLKMSLKDCQFELSEFRAFLLASLSSPALGVQDERLRSSLVLAVKRKGDELRRLRAELDKERNLLMAAERDARLLARRTLAAEGQVKRTSLADMHREIAEFTELTAKQDLLIDKLRERVLRTEALAPGESASQRVGLLTGEGEGGGGWCCSIV